MRRSVPDLLATRPFQLSLLLLCGFGLYGYTLNYPFVFDSRIYILGNPLITDLDAFRHYLRIDNFMDIYLPRLSHRDLVTSFLMRPLAYLSFHLNYLHGELNPAGYRLVNLAIHLGNGLLLYQFLSLVLRKRTDATGTLLPTWLPFFAALLFLVHPLQTQSVTYVAQRFSSLAMFFSLATLLLYLASRTARSSAGRRWGYGLSLVTLLAGMATKESVVTLPLTLLLLDVILLRQPLREAALRLVPHFAAMVLIPLQVVRIADELRSADVLLPSVTGFVGDSYSRADYAITQLRVVLDYLRLLLVPYGQNFDPDYPLYHSLFQPQIVLALLVWSLLLLAGIRLYRRRGRDIGTDLMLFSLCWFPLAISVSSSFIPLTDLMFEHRTYLPSAAIFTGGVTALLQLPDERNGRYRQGLIGALCLLAMVYGGATIARNLHYRSRIAIWEDTVAKSPNKARPVFALGNAYLDEGRFDEGVACLKRALALEPAYLEASLSLGTAYLQRELPQQAVAVLEKARQRFPASRLLRMNLALAYAESGRVAMAIDLLQQEQQAESALAGELGLLAELHYRSGNYAKAHDVLLRAMAEDRNDPTVDLTDVLRPLRERILEEVGRAAAVRS